ncbi:modulator of drug activity protein, putative [Trichomonas vaginalis G3]|uniref:Modulator of drug activity protein, putative n=1 Tax=Trichomonas vaginalis (strain ATCC PRA-98 / G3) TaxID=412133 RepID=A2EA33_TRIV3|nr:flavodoxin-like fold [Trichomonas vaginalis G3]EAY10479.1 modulator of drug activity protein, putative [Trichomonas vaginalis G3]KAI5489293.1 flavodoxin-like fold [Trichomonas vaginalis G3]|eukprot:XP_001322702.1 modulator of drug activity protein [Trichomonas vaginalis G3]
MSLKNSKVLIIIAGFSNPPMSQGMLNESLGLEAKKYLEHKGHQVKVTQIAKGYKVEEEIEKFKWADVIIFQSQTWWIGLPNPAKKYIDEVLTAYIPLIEQYKGKKKIMVSATFGALEETIHDKNTCYEGLGAEQVWWPLYAAFVYSGFEKLPMVAYFNSFSRHFVYQERVDKLHAHLDKVFV